MLHELSEALAKSESGMTIKLYSGYPFPNRASRKLDAFAKDAMDVITDQTIFHQILKNVSGRQSAIPMILL
jgi:hypothetical protein